MAGHAFSELVERAAACDRIRGVLALLKRYENLFRLPTRIRQASERGLYDQVLMLLFRLTSKNLGRRDKACITFHIVDPSSSLGPKSSTYHCIPSKIQYKVQALFPKPRDCRGIASTPGAFGSSMQSLKDPSFNHSLHDWMSSLPPCICAD